MKRIIVTADDFGMCKSVDDAILDMIEKGALTTTNAMMNMDLPEDITKLKKYENISVGIHWNLTTGRPLSRVKDIPTIVNEQGEFYSLTELKKRIRYHKVRREDIRRELLLQYNLFCSLYGNNPAYWNTHENSGLIPFVYKECEKIALEKGIEGTRNFQRVYLDFDLVNNPTRRMREVLVRILMWFWFGFFASRKFMMPAGRIITFYNESKCNLTRMKKAIDACRKESVEVVIHPATEKANAYFGNIGADRYYEYQCYCSEAIFELWRRNQLINYKDLKK